MRRNSILINTGSKILILTIIIKIIINKLIIMSTPAPTYLYIGGTDYHSDAEQAWQWVTNSKAGLTHRRLRALGLNCRRIKYPLACVPRRARYQVLLTSWATTTAIGVLLIAVAALMLPLGAARVCLSMGLAALVGLSAAARTYYRHFLVTGLEKRARGEFASKPIWAEQLEVITRRIRTELAGTKRPIVLVGCGAGGHLVSLVVLKLIADANNKWPSWLRAVVTSDCIYDIEGYVDNSQVVADCTLRLIVEPAFGSSKKVWKALSPLRMSAKKRALLPPEVKTKWFVCVDFAAGDIVKRLQARDFATMLGGDAARQLVVGHSMGQAYAPQFVQLLREFMIK